MENNLVSVTSQRRRKEKNNNGPQTTVYGLKAAPTAHFAASIMLWEVAANAAPLHINKFPKKLPNNETCGAESLRRAALFGEDKAAPQASEN